MKWKQVEILIIDDFDFSYKIRVDF